MMRIPRYLLCPHNVLLGFLLNPNRILSLQVRHMTRPLWTLQILIIISIVTITLDWITTYLLYLCTLVVAPGQGFIVKISRRCGEVPASQCEYPLTSVAGLIFNPTPMGWDSVPAVAVLGSLWYIDSCPVVTVCANPRPGGVGRCFWVVP